MRLGGPLHLDNELFAPRSGAADVKNGGPGLGRISGVYRLLIGHVEDLFLSLKNLVQKGDEDA